MRRRPKPFVRSMRVKPAKKLPFEMASPAPPVSTADVLARLGQSGVWSDDETEADGSSDDLSGHPRERLAVEQPEPGASICTGEQHHSYSSTKHECTSGSDDEEESIEAYMARLMNRVRGTDLATSLRESRNPRSSEVL